MCKYCRLACKGNKRGRRLNLLLCSIFQNHLELRIINTPLFLEVNTTVTVQQFVLYFDSKNQEKLTIRCLCFSCLASFCGRFLREFEKQGDMREKIRIETKQSNFQPRKGLRKPSSDMKRDCAMWRYWVSEVVGKRSRSFEKKQQFGLTKTSNQVVQKNSSQCTYYLFSCRQRVFQYKIYFNSPTMK